MSKLYGKNYSKNDLLEKVGDISQIGGIKIFTLEDGSQRGVKVAEFKTGSGLNFNVLFDRGMDISSAEFKGVPLAYRSPNGDVHPSYYQPEDFEWLRTFEGGLVTTCGLTYLGAPCEDKGEKLGLHGRISTLPAREIAYGGYWEKDDYIMFTEGTMREAVIFKENIYLRRRIECRLGEPIIRIHDHVRNDGYIVTPFMILYHINIGFPVVDEGSILITPATDVIPRDEIAKPGLKEYNFFSKPIKGYQEQVFYHELESDSNGNVNVKLINKNLSDIEGLYVKYNLAQLPRYIEWKMMGMGTYVVGIEPANCGVEGRVKDRERKTLQFLEPGEEKDISLEIGVIER